MRTLVVSTCLFVAGVGLAARAESPPDREKLKAELMEADRKFAAAAKARGLDGWMAFMAADAVRLPKPGAKPITGLDNIRKADAALFADATKQLVWEPTDGGAFATGDHGFTTGNYRVLKRAADGTETVVGRGSYVTWWRKDAGGWRVILDTGTADPPPPK